MNENNSELHWKVWWDDKNQIIRSWFTGKTSQEDAEKSLKEINKLAYSHNCTALLSDSTKTETMDAGARKVFASAGKTTSLTKVAVVGASTTMRVITNFIVSVAQTSVKIKYFENEKDAILWLQES